MRLATLLLAFGTLLWADGGTVQLQGQAGPYLVTVFSEPVPVRVGRVDLSVLCQRLADKGPVLDARVLVHLRRPGRGDILELTVPARHGNATNKLLYAAALNIPSSGVWRFSVDIERENSLVSVAGTMRVADKEPPLATYWPFFAMVPLIAGLFGVNRWLRRGRASRYQPMPRK